MWSLIANIIGSILGSKSAGGRLVSGVLNTVANSARNQPQPQANQI